MAKKGKKNSNLYRFNTKLDRALVSANGFEVYAPYALQQLSLYLEDLDNLHAGLSMEDIGIKERRDKKQSFLVAYDGSSAMTVKEFFDSDDENEEEVNTKENSDKHYISVVRIDGMMRMQGGLSSRGIREICNEISRLDASPEIGAIILDVNTGGGEKASGIHLYNTIVDCSTPVITYGHLIGSAGVRGTAASDEIIMASATSDFGSIGSMVQIDKGVAKWYKKNVDEIYSSASPKKNYEWREYLKGNKQPIMNSNKRSSEDFAAMISKHRDIPEDKKEKAFSGGIFPADEAEDMNLIDGIGTFGFAVERAVFHIERIKKSKSKNTDMTTEQFSKAKKTLEKIHGCTFKAENIVDLLKEVEDTISPVSEQVEAAKVAAKEETEKSYKAVTETLTTKVKALEDAKKEEEEEEEEDDAKKENPEEKSETLKALEALTKRFDALEADNKVTKAENKKLETKVAKQKAEAAGTQADANTGKPGSLKDLTNSLEQGAFELEIDFGDK